MGTKFEEIYEVFLHKIKDDLYLALTPEQTNADLYGFLRSSIIKFRYPRVDLNTRDSVGFNAVLSDEEIEILARLMKYEWLVRQIDDMDNVKQEYTDKDFKLTSQANHLDKLLALRSVVNIETEKSQKLYSRRVNGKPNFSGLAGS